MWVWSVLAGLSSAVLAAGAEVRLLPESIGFQPDTSQIEGLGYISIPLSSEYTGREEPLVDYSVTFWYRCAFPGSGLKVTSSAVAYWVEIETKSVKVANTAVSSWRFVGTAHCGSQALIRLCQNADCSQFSVSPKAALGDGQIITIANGVSPFSGQYIIGDMNLHTEKCMTAAEFSAKQAGKADLPGCLPGNGGFYNYCGRYGLVVTPAFSGETDLSNPAIGVISTSFSSFQTSYGVTIIGQNVYVSGWYKYSSFPSTPASVMLFSSYLTQESILLEASMTPSTGPITFRLSWNFLKSYGLSNSVSANCATLPSTGFVYVYMQIEESGGNTAFTVCCQDDSTCSTLVEVATGLWTGFTANDFITFFQYTMYYMKVVPYAGVAAPLSAAFFTGIQQDPPLSAIDGKCQFSGASCTACPVGYYLTRNNCRPCHPYCASCTSSGLHRCLACKPGFYSQPNHPSLCLPTCPTGSTLSAGSCSPVTTNYVLDVDFSQHATTNFTVAGNQRIIVQSFYDQGAYFLPGRGLFLNYTPGSVSLPYNYNQATLLLNTDVSFDTWLYPYDYPSLYTSVTSNALVFQCGTTTTLTGAQKLAIQTKNYRELTVMQESNLDSPGKMTGWVHLGFTLSYDSATHTTTAYLIKNLEIAVPLLLPSFLREFNTTMHYFGGGFSAFTQLAGIVHSLRIANYARPLTAFLADLGSCSGCSACPAQTNTCLSLCKPNQYIAPYGVCGQCSEDCKNGCAGPGFCDYCADPICKDCDFATNSCLQCYDGATLINGKCTCNNGFVVQNGTCVRACSEGFFLQSGVCRACAWGCKHCESLTVCTECHSQFLRIDGKCTCGAGWYMTESLECKECDVSCLSCERGSLRCTSCHTETGYFLNGTSCLDCRSVPGYSGGLGISPNDLKFMQKTASVETVCKETCGDGVVMGQSQCDDGNSVYGDGCSSDCTIEPGWTCTHQGNSSSVCVDTSRPAPLLQYLNATSDGCVLRLAFNETVVSKAPIDGRVKVRVGYYDLFSYSVTPTFGVNPANLTYDISITFFQTVEADTKVTATVHSDITDTSGNSLATNTADAHLLESFSITTIEYVDIATAVYSGSVVCLSLLSLAASVLVSGRYDSFWTLVESLQLVNALLYGGVKMPDNLRHFLRGLGFANLGLMPNVVRWVVDNDNGKAEAPFAREDVGVDFIINIGGAMTIWLVLSGAGVIVLMMSCLFSDTKCLGKLRKAFTYSVFLRFAVESYLQTTFAVALQLTDPRPRDSLDPFNLIGTVLGSLLLIALPLFIFLKVTVRTSIRVKAEEYKEKYGTLYDCYKTSRKLRRSFLLIRLLRRLLFAVFLVSLYDEPKAQMSLLLAVTAGYLCAVAFLRPFRARALGSAAQVGESVLLLLAQGVMLALAVEGYGISVRNALGWLAIALFVAHITVTLSLLVTDSALQVLARVTKLYHDYAVEVVERMKLRKAEELHPELDTTVIPTEIDEGQQQPQRKVAPLRPPAQKRDPKKRLEIVGARRRK